MNMAVGNTFFKKRASHLNTYESGPSKLYVHHCMPRGNQRKLLRDIKVLHNEECITQHKPVSCDYKMRKVTGNRRMFLPRRKIWKLLENGVKSDFRSYINNYGASSQEDTSVKVSGSILI